MLFLGPHFEEHAQFNLLEPHPVTPSGAMPREDARAEAWGHMPAGAAGTQLLPSSARSGLPNRASLALASFSNSAGPVPSRPELGLPSPLQL